MVCNRGELRARNIRTLVVLVQKSPPRTIALRCTQRRIARHGHESLANRALFTVGTADSSHEERLSNFRKRAEVDSKRIIYFYESDISGSVGRYTHLLHTSVVSC